MRHDDHIFPPAPANCSRIKTGNEFNITACTQRGIRGSGDLQQLVGLQRAMRIQLSILLPLPVLAAAVVGSTLPIVDFGYAIHRATSYSV
jgi:hypothetical protein